MILLQGLLCSKTVIFTPPLKLGDDYGMDGHNYATHPPPLSPTTLTSKIVWDRILLYGIMAVQRHPSLLPHTLMSLPRLARDNESSSLTPIPLPSTPKRNTGI